MPTTSRSCNAHTGALLQRQGSQSNETPPQLHARPPGQCASMLQLGHQSWCKAPNECPHHCCCCWHSLALTSYSERPSCGGIAECRSPAAGSYTSLNVLLLALHTFVCRGRLYACITALIPSHSCCISRLAPLCRLIQCCTTTVLAAPTVSHQNYAGNVLAAKCSSDCCRKPPDPQRIPPPQRQNNPPAEAPGHFGHTCVCCGAA